MFFKESLINNYEYSNRIFLEKLGNNYFENLFPKIFKKNNLLLREFNDLKHAIKHGKENLKFIYKPQLANEF